LLIYCISSPTGRVDAYGLKDYKIGKDDPEMESDPGAGEQGSEDWTLKMWILKQQILHSCRAVKYPMPNAVAHLRYYFGNSGGDYSIALESMLRDVPSAKDLYEDELEMAKEFAEGLSIGGEHHITSGSASSGYNTKAESKDWFYAVGGYRAWGKGKVEITCGENGKKKYELTFTYKFWDRYNWDKGKSVTIGPIRITDDFMGAFHRQGMAKEFTMKGSVTKTVEWEEGDDMDTEDSDSDGDGGGRDRR